MDLQLIASILLFAFWLTFACGRGHSLTRLLTIASHTNVLALMFLGHVAPWSLLHVALTLLISLIGDIYVAVDEYRMLSALWAMSACWALVSRPSDQEELPLFLKIGRYIICAMVLHWPMSTAVHLWWDAQYSLVHEIGLSARYNWEWSFVLHLAGCLSTGLLWIEWPNLVCFWKEICVYCGDYTGVETPKHPGWFPDTPESVGYGFPNPSADTPISIKDWFTHVIKKIYELDLRVPKDWRKELSRTPKILQDGLTHAIKKLYELDLGVPKAQPEELGGTPTALLDGFTRAVKNVCGLHLGVPTNDQREEQGFRNAGVGTSTTSMTFGKPSKLLSKPGVLAWAPHTDSDGEFLPNWRRPASISRASTFLYPTIPDRNKSVIATSNPSPRPSTSLLLPQGQRRPLFGPQFGTPLYKSPFTKIYASRDAVEARRLASEANGHEDASHAAEEAIIGQLERNKEDEERKKNIKAKAMRTLDAAQDALRSFTNEFTVACTDPLAAPTKRQFLQKRLPEAVNRQIFDAFNALEAVNDAEVQTRRKNLKAKAQGLLRDVGTSPDALRKKNPIYGEYADPVAATPWVTKTLSQVYDHCADWQRMLPTALETTLRLEIQAVCTIVHWTSEFLDSLATIADEDLMRLPGNLATNGVTLSGSVVKVLASVERICEKERIANPIGEKVLPKARNIEARLRLLRRRREVVWMRGLKG